MRIPFRRIAIASSIAASASILDAARAQAVDPFLGEVICVGFNFTPPGWLPTDGRLLPISQNTALFSLLGTTYGGDGMTNFALPNLQGRFLLDQGASGGGVNHVLGESGGGETVTLTTAQLPPHSHLVAPLASNDDANSMSPTGKVPATKARTTLYTDPVDTTSMAATTTSATGGGQPVGMMPPYQVLNCMIATQGVFPSRN